jgi:phosphatidylglycerophosphate synthase
VLTFARLAMVPAFVALWFDGGASVGRPPAAAAVFIAAAVTDWADGYLARRVS